MTELPPWLIRVKSESGYPVGVGFFVGRGSIITCAHVVNQALGRRAVQEPKPDRDEVLLDFPLTSVRWTARAKVRTGAWVPIDTWGEGDIAVLEVVDSLPPVLEPAKLKEHRSLWGHPYRAYGFPVNNDRGEWTRGELLGPVGRDWIQLESVSVTGAAIEEGFSGSPVWDDKVECVVGMIVAADRNPAAKTGFMIPNQVLLRAMASQEEGKRAGIRGMRAALRSRMNPHEARTASLTRNYSASQVNIAGLVQVLAAWCRSQAMEVQIFEHEGINLIQARRAVKHTWTRVFDTRVPTIRLGLTGAAWQLAVGLIEWIPVKDEHFATVATTAMASWARTFSAFGVTGLIDIFTNVEQLRFAQRALEVADYFVHSDEGPNGPRSLSDETNP